MRLETYLDAQQEEIQIKVGTTQHILVCDGHENARATVRQDGDQRAGMHGGHGVPVGGPCGDERFVLIVVRAHVDTEGIVLFFFSHCWDSSAVGG